MTMILGELATILKVDKKQLTVGLEEAKAEVKAAGKDMDQSADVTGKAIGAALAAGGVAGTEKLTRESAGKLRNAKGQFVAAGQDAGKGFDEGLAQSVEAGVGDARGWLARAFQGLGGEAAVAAAKASVAWITGSSETKTRITADIEASKKKIRELADEYGKTGNKSLLGDMSRERSQVREFETVLDSLSRGALAAFGSGLQTAWSTLGGFASSVGSFASSLWGIAIVLLAIGAAAMVAVPAIYLLGGVLGSLPALAVGGGAALGALGLGFMGLSQAFQKTASSGSSVVDRAYQIALAERRVRDANIEVLASEEALTRARQQAAENLDDLNRSLAGAHLDEESAIQGVADAQAKLAAAQLTEDPGRIAAADLAYRKAQQSLAEVHDRVEDLAAEQADAAAKGVEGSDQVRQALTRQQHAVEGVTDAMHGLKEAQKPPPSGGAAAQLTKLSPAAAAAVAAIKSLKPAFESLRLDVQERLFSGVGGEIKSLATAWLPTLHERLGGMASMFNGLFKNLAASAKDPAFIRNIGAGMKSVEDMFNRIGTSITGPFMGAFGKLAAAAAPFITTLGDEIGGLVDDFSTWIEAGDKSGGLQKFFVKASGFLHDFFDIGRDVGSIIGSIFSILFKAPTNATEGPFESFKLTLDKLAAWFKDPTNQAKVDGWIKKVEDFVIWLGTDFVPGVNSAISFVDRWVKRIDGWVNSVIDFKNRTVGAFDALVGAVTGLPGRIGNGANGMWDGIKNEFRSAVNWIIGKWNNLSLTIGGGSFLGVDIPSMRFDTPDIPYLAKGGVFPATPGGRLAVLAEAGKTEIATPEDLMRRIVREETGAGRTEPTVVENHIHIGDEVTRVVRTEIKQNDRGTRRQVLAGAGAR